MMAFIDLAAQQARLRARIDARISTVLDHGGYIMGPEVAEFEAALSDYCGARHTITCANGTDALQLALMALQVGAGDAVFVPSFTFAATAEVVPVTGATPIFVDCCAQSYTICPASLSRAISHAVSLGLVPRAVIAVDLFGLPADYDALREVIEPQGMALISDSAQGFGSVYKGQNSGQLGEITTTSFFPAKPLGCYGDGGALFTDDNALAHRLRSLRVHGKGAHKYENMRVGLNSRLDTLQAAILCEKLAIFPDELTRRQEVAVRYSDGLGERFHLPHVPQGSECSWAQYTLRPGPGLTRDQVMSALKEAGIPSGIYYPVPLHKQAAYRDFPCDPEGLPISERLSAEVFSLPMHPYLEPEDQARICAVLRAIGDG